MSNDNDADSVHSMTKSPPPTMVGSPKPTFLSNGHSSSQVSPPIESSSHGGIGRHHHISSSSGGINHHHNNNHNNNNSDNEDLSPAPPPFRSSKAPRERYWGLNVEADTGGSGDWVLGHRDIDPPDSPTKMNDDMSEVSSQMPMMPMNPGGGGVGVIGAAGTMPRSKSRTDMDRAGAKVASSKYNNLSFWKARRMTFYRNGDPFFPGIEYIFKPGRDIVSIDALLDKLTKRMDLPRGARFVFDMAGDRKYTLDDLEDGASYVVSSFKVFKVSGSSKAFVQFNFTLIEAQPYCVEVKCNGTKLICIKN